MAGGLSTATGANIMSWASHHARTTGQDWTPVQGASFYAVCLIFTLGGIGLFALATGLGGAVATVMPIQIGSNLLANMFFQMALRIKFFDKGMRVGTMVLVAAVAELAYLGPKSPEKPDFMELLSKPTAIIWVIILHVGVVLSLIACKVTAKYPASSFVKLGSYMMVVTLTTVVGSSISKVLFLVSGFERVAAFILYFLHGIFCLSFTVMANAQCDVSIFVPAQLSSQLLVNMVTGFLVWEDAKYIELPVPYLLVYLISICGVYLISPQMDAFSSLLRHRAVAKSMLSEGTAESSMGRSVLELYGAWNRQKGVRGVTDPIERDMCRNALLSYLERGRESGIIRQQELALLVASLMQEHGWGPCAAVVHWLLNDLEYFQLYNQHDPKFREQLRDLLSKEEQQKLDAWEAMAYPELYSDSDGISLVEMRAEATLLPSEDTGQADNRLC